MRRSTQALIFIGEGAAAKAAEVSRKRPAIGGTTTELVDILGRYAELGVDEFIVPTMGRGSTAEINDFADQFRQDVAAQL